MKELERYFKIYFDTNGNKNHTGYYIEEENVISEFEYIPLLTHGYVRCINALKKSFFGHDEEAVKVFRLLVREILLLSRNNIAVIKNHYKENANFDVLSFLINKDVEAGINGGLINNFFSSFYEVKNKSEITGNVYVEYKVQMRSKGPVVMYNMSLRMKSLIQIQAYILMLGHLLRRFKNFNSFLFFYNYMIETEIEIEKNNYTSFLGMLSIISNSATNLRKNYSEKDKKDGYDLLMSFCVPKF